jgi:hypothetical protein
MLKNGATMDEVRFLYSGHRLGKRVELNAFTSGAFLGWIETKLAEYGIKKVIPDQATLEAAYRRAFEIESLKHRLKEFEAADRAQAASAPLPHGLAGKIRKRLTEQPELSWDTVLAEVVASRFVKTDG